MDKYTEDTKKWLDERFTKCDENGIYFAHQPIYGFRKGHSERGIIERHIRTYEILKALACLRFSSLVDIGGAEGFKANLASKLFNCRVTNSDLSEQACKRANELFGMESRQADIHSLPFRDGEFDVVLCSETLEHVTDFDRALDELLRVARIGVIITVPHEPKHLTEENIEGDVPHAHIHNFKLDSLEFVREKYGYSVLSKPLISPFIRIPAAIVEAMPRNPDELREIPRIAIKAYNAVVPVLRTVFGKRVGAWLMRYDEFLCRLLGRHTALLFVIIKDNASWGLMSRRISPLDILNFGVPFHYLHRQGRHESAFARTSHSGT